MIRWLCFLAAILAAASAPAEAVGKNVVVPIQVEQGLVLATVRVGESAPLTMIVDTGAASTVLSSARLAETGLGSGNGTRASVQGGEVEAQTVERARILIGSERLTIDSLAVIDLSGLTASVGRRIDGILGYELFAKYTVEIDYRRHRMTLRPPGSGDEATGIPLEVRGNTPFVAAELQRGGYRAAGRLLIDTGGVSAVTLYAQFLNGHSQLVPADARAITAGAVLPGQFRARVARMDVVEVGSLRFREPVVNFSGSVGADDAAPGDAGQIGAGVLSRFRVTIDLSARRLYLEPQPGVDEPYAFDASGISLIASADDPRVRRIRQVLPDSPAAEAGLSSGDLLVSLDGRDARAIPLGTLRTALRAPGRAHALIVERDGRRLRVRLTTRRLI